MIGVFRSECVSFAPASMYVASSSLTASRSVADAIQTVRHHIPMATKRLYVKVTTTKGVSDACSLPTKSAVQTWIDGWYESDSLNATITDASGVEVGHKPPGRSRIVWGAGRVALIKQRIFGESVKALFKA